ncbi:MAG: type II toxin-antitoxin system PemK/MazF family toxin [SAR324 cluster bacterium]|nr:type II toxin-antitoxin system PemK/MazF family toxin [SAR324 cluster bacterium]
MPSMTTYNFGDVLLIPFPFTDQTATKKRPAVVISSSLYQQSKPDVIVMAVTSQVRSAQLVGEFLIEDWKEAGLIKPSVGKPVITTLEQSMVLQQLGTLQSQDLQSLRKCLKTILG